MVKLNGHPGETGRNGGYSQAKPKSNQLLLPTLPNIKVGIFLGLAGAAALVILEGAYFRFSSKRLLFNSPAEKLNLFDREPEIAERMKVLLFSYY